MFTIICKLKGNYNMKKTLIILTLTTLHACGNHKHYKPCVMPTGKGELTKKQIKRDLTN